MPPNPLVVLALMADYFPLTFFGRWQAATAPAPCRLEAANQGGLPAQMLPGTQRGARKCAAPLYLLVTVPPARGRRY